MTDLDRLIRSIRLTAGYDDPVLLSAKQIFALTSEVLRLRGDEERLRAVEADAERVRVKAELWSYYEAFVAANGAGSITELVIQRDEARTAADTERAAVLAYLRAAYAPNTIVPLPDFLAALLRMVEKGEHHRKGNE
jgi:hypothetical protein